MDSIIDNFRKMAEEWKRQDEETINRLREEGLLELNNGAWDDTYDILGYNPPCPKCRTECPNCGELIFDGDFDYSSMPEKEDIDFSTFYNH